MKDEWTCQVYLEPIHIEAFYLFGFWTNSPSVSKVKPQKAKYRCGVSVSEIIYVIKGPVVLNIYIFHCFIVPPEIGWFILCKFFSKTIFDQVPNCATLTVVGSTDLKKKSFFLWVPSEKRAPAMFLTLVLLRKGIPGKQWIGKYRRPRPVTWQMKRNMLKHLEREAQNEYWISRPYMTLEQEAGHAAERRAQNLLRAKENKFNNFPKHKTITDHLAHLGISKNWSS